MFEVGRERGVRKEIINVGGSWPAALKRGATLAGKAG